jgi:hypothetical protein
MRPELRKRSAQPKALTPFERLLWERLDFRNPSAITTTAMEPITNGRMEGLAARSIS